MRLGEGLRNEAIIAGLDQAIASKGATIGPLYKHLGLASGLPGPRANISMAHAFAVECVARGAAVDPILFAMIAIEPDSAPGATALEFLPLCAVLALGARAAEDPSIEKRVLGILHDAAEDPRFRVRDAVPPALARIGERKKGALVVDLASWMDGYHHAAAVILALAEPRFLSTLEAPDDAVARLDEAYLLARNAPSSALRWPGFKALVDALSKAPSLLAARFGVPVFDRLVAWSDTEMPELRDAIKTNLKDNKLSGRFADELKRVHAALDASVPPPRDPTLARQGMRSRGKKRSRR